MPLRIRTDTNKVITLDAKAKFLEVVADDGCLCSVVYIDAYGMTMVEHPGDAMFDKYVKLFGIKKYATRTIEVDL